MGRLEGTSEIYMYLSMTVEIEYIQHESGRVKQRNEATRQIKIQTVDHAR